MKSKKNNRKNIDDLIVEIMRLALLVNRETSSDVFLNFSGHVNLIDIEINYDGWEARKDYDLRESFYIDDDKLSSDRFEKCGEIIAKLEELMENK